jgi:2-polyprenyl-6-methoxyphenol hydroxylase-like FAD-dependent oxidoreductase
MNTPTSHRPIPTCNDGFAPEFAVDTKNDTPFDQLNIIRYSSKLQTNKLSGLRITVIGAGPAGLVFARDAVRQGAEVTVIEKAGDPRGDNPGYTNRSFNITLDNIGRQVVGDSRAWQGGIWLSGRAIHNFQGSDDVHYTRYGKSSDAELISIPRPVLRQNLCTLAEDSGAHLKFGSTVTETNTTSGDVFYIDAANHRRHIQADLIVFSDGLHSLIDETTDQADTVDMQLWTEPRSYVAASISADHADPLSLNHIHFWHEASGAFTIGIPNADGSVTLLLASEFNDIAKDIHPFATTALATRRLQLEFPRLLAIAPELPTQLPTQQRGHFSYKSVSNYRVGKRGVIVGDAGCSIPPWAGYGANKAMYAAASLSYELTAHADAIDSALDRYDSQQRNLAQELMAFAKGQGDFLSGSVKDRPSGRSQPALGILITELLQNIDYTSRPISQATHLRKKISDLKDTVAYAKSATVV